MSSRVDSRNGAAGGGITPTAPYVIAVTPAHRSGPPRFSLHPRSFVAASTHGPRSHSRHRRFPLRHHAITGQGRPQQRPRTRRSVASGRRQRRALPSPVRERRLRVHLPAIHEGDGARPARNRPHILHDDSDRVLRCDLGVGSVFELAHMGSCLFSRIIRHGCRARSEGTLRALCGRARIIISSIGLAREWVSRPGPAVSSRGHSACHFDTVSCRSGRGVRWCRSRGGRDGHRSGGRGSRRGSRGASGGRRSYGRRRW